MKAESKLKGFGSASQKELLMKTVPNLAQMKAGSKLKGFGSALQKELMR